MVDMTAESIKRGQVQTTAPEGSNTRRKKKAIIRRKETDEVKSCDFKIPITITIFLSIL